MNSLKRKTLVNCLLTKWWHILNCYSLGDQTRETENDSPVREMKDIMASWSVTLQSQVQCGPELQWQFCVRVCMCVQFCLTAILLDSSAQGISQARILEWVAISYSKGSSRPRKQTHIPYISYLCKQYYIIIIPILSTKAQKGSECRLNNT